MLLQYFIYRDSDFFFLINITHLTNFIIQKRYKNRKLCIYIKKIISYRTTTQFDIITTICNDIELFFYHLYAINFVFFLYIYYSCILQP